jgi:hypothetical protein
MDRLGVVGWGTSEELKNSDVVRDPRRGEDGPHAPAEVTRRGQGDLRLCGVEDIAELVVAVGLDCIPRLHAFLRGQVVSAYYAELRVRALDLLAARSAQVKSAPIRRAPDGEEGGVPGQYQHGCERQQANQTEGEVAADGWYQGDEPRSCGR